MTTNFSIRRPYGALGRCQRLFCDKSLALRNPVKKTLRGTRRVLQLAFPRWLIRILFSFFDIFPFCWLRWSSSSSSLASWRPSLPLLAPGRRSFSVGRRLRRRRRRSLLPPPGSWSVGRSPSLLQNYKTPFLVVVVVVFVVVVVLVCH